MRENERDLRTAKKNEDSSYERFVGRGLKAVQQEIDRLGAQATVLNYFSRALFERLVQSGQLADPQSTKIVNLGSGPGFELPYLLDYTNQVVCIDTRDYRNQVAQIAQRFGAEPRVHFHHGQLETLPTDMATGTRVIKTRFSLVHMPIEMIIKNTLRAAWETLPSGGLLIAEEPGASDTSWYTEPVSPDFTALHQAFLVGMERQGKDHSLGQNLPDILTKIGFQVVHRSEYQIVCHRKRWPEFRGPHAGIFGQMINGMKEAGVPPVLLHSLRGHLADYEKYLKDPNYLVAAPIMVQIAARKPV